LIKTAAYRKWIPPVLIVLLGGALIIGIRYYRIKWKKDHVFVELKAIQTPKGWGYDILTDGHPYIHQNFIPAIPGEYGFRTRKDALAVGQIVADRLIKGQTPMVTASEIKEMGITPDTP
jgi:hypothetical protein